MERYVTINGKRKVTPEYTAWQHAKDRCFNSKNGSYKNYGGRGITFCPEWLSFNQFILDMGDKPSSELTLERRDNNLGYSKDNCYWGTRLEQSRNRRCTKMYKGKYSTEIAKELGMTIHGFKKRLRRLYKGEITEEELYLPEHEGRKQPLPQPKNIIRLGEVLLTQ